MRLTRFLSIVGLLTISIQTAQAQDTLPSAPWPPEDPRVFFAENVEIVNIELRSSAIEGTRGATVDPDRQLVLIEDGREYPLPQLENVQFGNYVEIFINERVYIPNISGMEPVGYWQLDLATGDWTLLTATPEYLDTICGSVEWSKLSRNPAWVVINGSNNRQHICSLRDGRVSPPLPANYRNWELRSASQYQDSSVELVVLLPISDVSSGHVIYIYDASLREIIHVANIPIEDEAQSRYGYRSLLWTQLIELEDRSLFLKVTVQSNTDSNVQTPYAYRIIVEERQVETLSQNSIYRFDPPRLDDLQEVREGDTISCQVTSFDLETEQTITYQVQTTCNGGYQRGQYLYYRIINEDETTADVIRVNIETGASEHIYTGEIEAILWISPDYSYAAFVLDYNGTIDTLPQNPDVEIGASQEAQAILLEIATGNVTFQSDASAPGPFLAPTWIPYFYSVTDRYVAISDGIDTTLLEFAADDPQMWTLEGRLGRNVEEGWVFLSPPSSEQINEYGAVVRMSVYNIETHQTYPLFNLSGTNSSYYLAGDFEYLGDNLFRFTVGYSTFPNPDPAPPLYDMVTYTVRLQVTE